MHKSEIAVYDTGRYTPELSYEHLERLVRNPAQFSFQRFRVAGLRVALFEEYGKALFGGPRDIDILSIARPLSTFMLGLDEHTQKTRRLTSNHPVNSTASLLFGEITRESTAQRVAASLWLR